MATQAENKIIWANFELKLCCDFLVWDAFRLLRTLVYENYDLENTDRTESFSICYHKGIFRILRVTILLPAI